MPDDVLALRNTLRAANAALTAAQALLDDLLNELENDQGDLPPAALARLRAQVRAQQLVVNRDTAARDAAQVAYQTAVAADPMHAVDPGLPLVLLPVRIETAYLPGAAGTDLVVRVYPDDIHVDTHEPELTHTELSAGTAYWNAVWGAGPNQSRLDAAWNNILAKLRPLRAAWTVHALTPSDPRPATETPIDQPQPQPPLPSPPIRNSTFTRPARTTLLPDKWHVVAFRNGSEIFNVDGAAIPDSLDVSFGPPGTGAPASDLPFEQGSRWLVDLDAAIANGMALRIPLPGPDFTIDQLFVVGVSSAVAAADAASRLQSAFVAHQYTNGLAFLPPGTPTNNTPETRSAWEPAPQPPSPTDVKTARAAYQPASGQNAALAAKALGIDGSTALCIAPEAAIDQQFPVQTLQLHLWDALGSKTLSLLYSNWVIPPGGVPSQGTWVLQADLAMAQALKDRAVNWVRSRGTLPVLRVGNQPYGLLPALSLDGWVDPDADAPTATILTWLRTFRDYWRAALLSVPQAVPDGASADPDDTIVHALNRLPLCANVVLRRDGNPSIDKVGTFALPPAPIPGLSPTSQLFLSVPDENGQPLTVPLVTDAPGDQLVLTNFQSVFHDGILVLEQTITTQDFKDRHKSLFDGSKSFPGAPPPDILTSMVQDAFSDPLIQNNVNFAGSMAGFIICLALFFDPTKPDQQQLVTDNLPAAKDFVAQFDILCTVDPSTYDSVLREILDVFSHRLDAWITSFAAERLAAMRTATPDGLVLGAYGWVENLQPRTDLAPVVPPPSGFEEAFSSDLQKYIHAPSLQHAATAAVLRAGFESHADPSALAVNLVSSRVRVADWLATGVRNGQTVGALLGYRFERGLHDATLDVFIAPLRASFGLPNPPGADGDVNTGPARTSQAARNVVDGLALYRNAASVIPTLQADPDAAPSVTDAAVATVNALLADLANALDAFGDLLLAESVHHAVGGNPLRAGLAADTVGRGEPIPDRFDVVTTPRAGNALTWRIGALLPADFNPSGAGWNNDRPRAQVEPHVNAWAASILGPANTWQIACSVTISSGVTTQTLTLDTLGLAPLDIVSEISGSPSQLEQRIIESLTPAQPAGATISVIRTPAADGSLGFAELLSLVQRLQIVLGKATPITPQQLEGAKTSEVEGLAVSELDGRAQALETSFKTAVKNLSDALQNLAAASDVLAAVIALRSALTALADHGIPAAWPLAPADSSPDIVAALSGQASSLLAAVQPLADTPRPAASADAVWLAAVTAYVKNITTLAVPLLPAFSLPASSDYAKAFAPGNAPVGDDIPAAMVWLRRTARVRPSSAALHDLLLATETLQSNTASLTLAQLPSSPGDAWVGLPFPGANPPAARLAHVLCTPAPIDPAAAFCGFLCDTWVEHLPGLTTIAAGSRGYEPAEVTGLSFTVDAPSAYAPQAILLAVIPDQSLHWSLDILIDTLQETLDLAKVRMVDLGDLPRLGRVLPAIHSGYVVEQTLQGAGIT